MVSLAPDPTPLSFLLEPKPSGYAWWYLDAVSDDGRYAVVLIMFLGSVFSPRYAAARRRGPSDPLAHAAVNFVVYPLSPDAGPRVWAFNESAELERSATQLRIGATRMRWEGEHERLIVELDTPRTRFFGRQGRPLRGRLCLRPSALFAPRIELDDWRPEARHRWYPVAPHARMELELEAPELRFEGSAYHDVNEGDEGLEQGFRAWDWSRAELGERTQIAYDCVQPSGEAHTKAWRFDPRARTITTLEPEAFGPRTPLPNTRWRVPRALRGSVETAPRLLETLEDTPFYSRNLVELELDGQRCRAMHESVDLRRYAAPWVQFLLPFKIGRPP